MTDASILLSSTDLGSLATALSSGSALFLPSSAQRFAGLFDETRLRAVLSRMHANTSGSGPSFGAMIADPLGDGLMHAESILGRPDLVDSATGDDPIDAVLRAGHTICATDIASHDDALTGSLSEFRHALACPCDVRFNAYLSPTGATTRMHTDVRISTSLQLSGRKRWRYQQRAATILPNSAAQIDRWGDVHWMNPLANAGPPIPTPSPADLKEVTLGPGDLLSVPAGAWHEVVTEERGLALNLSIRPTPMSRILHALLDGTLGASPSWRQGLPILSGDHCSDPVPAEVRTRLLARLAELRTWIDEFDPEGDDFLRLWRALLDA